MSVPDAIFADAAAASAHLLGEFLRSWPEVVPATAPASLLAAATGGFLAFHAVAAVLLLALGSLFAHAAAALLLYRPTRLMRRLRVDADPLQPQTAEFQTLAAALAVVSTYAAQLYARAAFEGVFRSVVITVFLAATVFCCAILPVVVGKTRAEDVVIRTLPLLRGLLQLLRYPLVLPLLAVGRLVARLLGIPDQPPTAPDEIADEILAAVTDSPAGNALEENEKRWIENIVALKDLRASAIMTPRTDLITFESETPLPDAVAEAARSGHSRYPVYAGTIDRVIGVFHTKDVLAQVARVAGLPAVPVRSVVRKPLFVPETMPVDELLEQFKSQRTKLAVVLDEYGGTAGIITFEDVLEQIVGDIGDEHDAGHEDSVRVIEKDRVVEISGRARIDEVNELLGAGIPAGAEYETVSGFLFSSLGQVPKPGESFVKNGLRFKILKADDRQIERMRVSRLAEVPSGN